MLYVSAKISKPILLSLIFNTHLGKYITEKLCHFVINLRIYVFFREDKMSCLFISNQYDMCIMCVPSFFSFRYLVLDIADNPVENIIRFFPMVSCLTC